MRSTGQAGLWLCKAIMQEVLQKLLAASSKKDLAPKTHALQHPAFKGLAPRVDPRVRVLSAFAASDKSQTPLRLQNNFLLGMEPLTVSTLSIGWPEEKCCWLSCLRSSVPCSELPRTAYAHT